MPVLPVPLLPQVPMGKPGLVRALRWASLLSPFHRDVFAEQGKSSVLLPALVTWQGTGKLLVQLRPGQETNSDSESNSDSGSGLCRDQSILQLAAIETSSALGTWTWCLLQHLALSPAGSALHTALLVHPARYEGPGGAGSWWELENRGRRRQ